VRVEEIPLEELTKAVFEKPNTVFVFGHEKWRLSLAEVKKAIGSRSLDSHYNLESFPIVQRVQKEMSLGAALKQSYPAYVSSLEVRSCKSLEQALEERIFTRLGGLRPGGALDFLRVLDSKHRPDLPFFKNMDPNYAYANLYLYVGNRGTGTAIHQVKGGSPHPSPDRVPKDSPPHFSL